MITHMRYNLGMREPNGTIEAENSLPSTPHLNHCEQCGTNFEPFAGDKAHGQLCPQHYGAGSTIIKLTSAVDDDDPRYFGTLAQAWDFIEDGCVYGDWGEFNDSEWAQIGAEWNPPELDSNSFGLFCRSVEAWSQFFRDFWAKHTDILKKRDEEMDAWPSIVSGERQKPISWLNVPDFKIYLEELAK